MKSAAFAITLFVLFAGCKPAEKVQTYEEVVLLLDAETRQLNQLESEHDAPYKEASDKRSKLLALYSQECERCQEEAERVAKSATENYSPDNAKWATRRVNELMSKSEDFVKQMENANTNYNLLVGSLNVQMKPALEKLIEQKEIVEDLRELKDQLRNESLRK
jgi:hypothetical protein